MRIRLTEILILLLGLLPVVAQAEPVDSRQTLLVRLQTELVAGDWESATGTAKQLDAIAGRGDAFKAFSAAFRYAKTDECEKAVPLAALAVQALPGFLPAVDVWARCLVRQGNRQAAIDLYERIAGHYPDGRLRQAALERAKNLEPDRKIRFALETSLTPSTNTVRQTSGDRIGTLEITDESRAKPGVSFGATANAVKPLFHHGRLSGYARLRIGFNHDTVRRTLAPLIGIETTATFSVSPRTTASFTPFYERSWEHGRFHRQAAGARVNLAHALSDKQSLSVQTALFWQDYAADRRDGLTASVSLSHSQLLSASDRVTMKLHAAHNGARSDMLRNTEVSADAEWEHAFANGFVPSIGAALLYRRYDGPIPLGTENQWDVAATARIGLSHRKVRLRNVYPELTLSATRQWSNNVFYRHDALDAGIRLKTSF